MIVKHSRSQVLSCELAAFVRLPAPTLRYCPIPVIWSTVPVHVVQHAGKWSTIPVTSGCAFGNYTWALPQSWCSSGCRS